MPDFHSGTSDSAQKPRWFSSILGSARRISTMIGGHQETQKSEEEMRATSTLRAAQKVLRLDTISADMVKVEYAVRGEIAIRAEELRKQLTTQPGSLPFKQITNCNIGNPQQLQQKPITFFRQVASLVDYPDLLQEDKLPITKQLFATDAVERAKTYLGAIGSAGAYSHSQGIPAVRKEVAAFIEARDGYPADPENIFLTAGASPAVQLVLNALISHSKVGIMIPIPQYPLYTASIASSTELTEELGRSLKKARAEGTEVRALCLINPGNPTGQCLSWDNMKEIVAFCKKERLVLLADEVYQTNIYKPEELPFHSFKKVVKSMGPEYNDFELISFHSVSKGMIGECGRRGGYFECTNIDSKVMAEFYKICSISLCPPVQGQLMVGLMTNPPKEGDVSYPVYRKEMDDIYVSLKRRAESLAQASTNSKESLVMLLRVPSGAVAAAKKLGKQPDELYCLELLNETGVCVVPGSGFLQKEGTWHFRSTFLAPEAQMGEFAQSLARFHAKFMDKYRV
ncbi:PLP-dependent transferase [Rhizoclosmatium globosum]|uniref:Glutamate pyruvate transaminase n=1 Tax=Rhizoclosmatium globosum TaxID=329046 RepID=A0A1Y2CDG4_9FUNG|nr:PLP-dependent transferase [Rhizoclosmatium globosum]|eukprot:ORY45101.1 PLP-dependent transferase [Rhizoclosmatium globosum]